MTEVRVEVHFCVVLIERRNKRDVSTNNISVVLHNSLDWVKYVESGFTGDGMTQFFEAYNEEAYNVTLGKPSVTPGGRAVDMMLLTFDARVLTENDGFQYAELAPESQGSLAEQYAAADMDTRPDLAVKVVRDWLQRNNIPTEHVLFMTGVVR